jgi:hypothetical protein
LIKKINYINIYILYMYLYFKFLKKFFLKVTSNKTLITNIYKKKNLFFKKKNFKETLVSKRLTLVLKKRKRIKLFKPKKIDKGNFFLKKFFFKILLKNRKFVKTFPNFSSETRQTKITNFFLKNSKNNSHEYSLMNILLRSNFFFFFKDVVFYINSGFVFINNKCIVDPNYTVQSGDYIQLTLSKYLYRYIIFSRKLLKKKLALYRFNLWRFFKQKFFKKKQQLKTKKRKTPKFLYLFYLYKLNVPKTIEVDFLTLSLVVLKKESLFLQSSYYLNKPFSFKLFSLYNFKKIN